MTDEDIATADRFLRAMLQNGNVVPENHRDDAMGLKSLQTQNWSTIQRIDRYLTELGLVGFHFNGDPNSEENCEPGDYYLKEPGIRAAKMGLLQWLAQREERERAAYAADLATEKAQRWNMAFLILNGCFTVITIVLALLTYRWSVAH